ncbi:hypothetical protein LguiB_028351 [Lonicera macranthoides]
MRGGIRRNTKLIRVARRLNFNCRNVQFFQCAILGNNRKHTKLLTDPYLTALEMLDILKDRTLICKALAIGQHKNDTLTSIFSSE